MYVYILKTTTHPPKFYVGRTKNPKQRLQNHNDGKSKHTSKYRPWVFKNLFWFDDEEKACEFEMFLKSGSGRAFSKRHF